MGVGGGDESDSEWGDSVFEPGGFLESVLFLVVPGLGLFWFEPELFFEGFGSEFEEVVGGGSEEVAAGEDAGDGFGADAGGEGEGEGEGTPGGGSGHCFCSSGVGLWGCGLVDFEGGGEEDVDDALAVGLHDVGDFCVVEVGGGESGGEVGDDAEAAVGDSGFAEGDGFGAGGHSDDVGAEGSHHPDFGGGLVAGAVDSDVRGLGLVGEAEFLASLGESGGEGVGAGHVGVGDGVVEQGEAAEGPFDEVGADGDCADGPFGDEGSDGGGGEASFDAGASESGGDSFVIDEVGRGFVSGGVALDEEEPGVLIGGELCAEKAVGDGYVEGLASELGEAGADAGSSDEGDVGDGGGWDGLWDVFGAGGIRHVGRVPRHTERRWLRRSRF